MTPMDVVGALADGNARFLAGAPLERDFAAQLRHSARGQHPMAVVLGCIDSRVPHEIVFDKGVGDVFSVRVIGNVLSADVLGSLEYATAVAGAKLVVVLGHTDCGAIKGACDGLNVGHLARTLAHIAPAIERVGDTVAGERSSVNGAYVECVARANVEITLQTMTEQSPVLHDLVASGNVLLIGAMHDVATGEVVFMTDSAVNAQALGASAPRA